MLFPIHGWVEGRKGEETDLGVEGSLLLLCGLLRPFREGRGGVGLLDLVSVLKCRRSAEVVMLTNRTWTESEATVQV